MYVTTVLTLYESFMLTCEKLKSRLKAYLDSRGVPVPQSGRRDELLATVRLNKHKAATDWSAWTFDTWTIDNLK